MRRVALTALPVLLAALVAGCGSDDGGSGATATGPALPTVSGAYGDKPEVTLRKGTEPGSKLASKVLSTGDGPPVAKGDLLVADYLGEIYATGKVFDNSYDRDAPSSFLIGAGKVIAGWDTTLVGVPAGSRVVMVVPPADGYGAQGNAQAGIKGTDSLVFVVDLIASYSPTSKAPAATAVTDLPAGLPRVSHGKNGSRGEPRITIPDGAKPPTKPLTTVLATGSGPPVTSGRLAVLQYTAVSWAGAVLGSTWPTGPQGLLIGGPQGTPFDLLEGVPIGSRVLLRAPAPAGQDAGTDSVAVVVDVLGQHGPAKESA